MKSIKGPGIFLAQFVGDEAPFNSFGAICEWASSLGYEGVQIAAWDPRLIDLKKAAESKDYCDELKGTAVENGVEITELATHLQGQLVAVNPTVWCGTCRFCLTGQENMCDRFAVMGENRPGFYAEYTVVEQRDPGYHTERRSRASPRDDTPVTAQDAYESDDTERPGR